MNALSPAACGTPLLRADRSGEAAILDTCLPQSSSHELVGLVRLDADPAIFRARGQAAPSLFLALQLRLSSYPGARSPGRALSCFTLRPGERVALGLRSYRHDAALDARALCALDGLGEPARADLQRAVEQEQGRDERAAALHRNAILAGLGAPAAVDLGVVALTGDRRDATTSAGSLAGAIRRHVERLTRALDAHAQAADGHRQVSVDVRPLAPSEAGQDAAWVVENDDPGRTRRFTLRQMLQEVYSLTYLHALSLVYADGEAGGPRIAGLSAFDDLLAEVLLDRKAVSKVGKLIATQLRAIPDHRGTRVSFVEPPVAPGTGEPTVLRKRRDLVQSYRDKIVGGVILEVTQRRLRSASATLESVPL